MDYIMKLPELNCLKPNEETTFKKLVEEVAECNHSIEELREYEENNSRNYLLLSDNDVYKIREEYKVKLNNVLGEIMDIAQVCASQLFVFEGKDINVQRLFSKYIDKNSLYKDKNQSIFERKEGCRYIYFSPIDTSISLNKTMNLIIFSMGKIAQLAKFIGDNGETPIINKSISNEKYVYELFTIVQNCFNLLYSMEKKYNINIERIFDEHVEKLLLKGYYRV